MVAGRAACLNRVQGTIHRLCRAHFDNSERPAGVDLCIYCDVGFGLRFSPPIPGVPDPWGAVAIWLAGKAFLRRDNLRELHRSMNGALAKSVASGHEVKIHLRQYTLSDSCFCLRSLHRNRRRSIGWAFDHYEGSKLWMEYSSQSQNRWQNRCQRCAGTTLRSLCAGGASCIDRVGRPQHILFLPNIDCAERPLRAHIRVHGIMGWIESCCSRPISPAPGATILA
jgi:hypothetical protein